MSDNLDSLLNGYEVSVATSKDEDQIINLLKDVAKWLKEKEIDQWGFLADGGEDEEIRQAIYNKDTFSVKRNEKIVATFTLYHTQSEWDAYIWGRLNDRSAYLHRLAITRSEIGSGLGKKVLQWLESYMKQEGINILRLDCVEANIKLNRFYLNNGFEKVAINNEHSMFQKKL